MIALLNEETCTENDCFKPANCGFCKKQCCLRIDLPHCPSLKSIDDVGCNNQPHWTSDKDETWQLLPGDLYIWWNSSKVQQAIEMMKRNVLLLMRIPHCDGSVSYVVGRSDFCTWKRPKGNAEICAKYMQEKSMKGMTDCDRSVVDCLVHVLKDEGKENDQQKV